MTQTITNNDFIIWTFGESIYSAVVTEQTEKAVKVDVAIDGVWSNCSTTVYTKYAWLPKSAIVLDRGCKTLAKWIVNKGIQMKPIKKYYLENGVKKEI